MYNELKKRIALRKKRALRVRKGIKANSLLPRLIVYRSSKHLHAQVIENEGGKVLAYVGTLSKDVPAKSKESAKLIGEKIAEAMKGQNIEKVVFDRGPYKFHGLVAAVAEGARSKGLQL